MYAANYQNTQLRIREELAQCSYNPNMKDYIANMIMQLLNYPKKTAQARHFIKNMNQDKIMMVWYPMSVPFAQKSYNVPLQIYIMKNIPYEPPQIFLEVVQGSAANPTNKDINPTTRQILTNTLRNWGQYSNIDNVMNEIYASFCNVFPIYKTKPNQNSGYRPNQNSGYQPNQNSGYRPNQNSGYNPNQNQYGNNSGTSGGGGIYNVLNNAVQNAYQQNKYGPYQPPTTSIYGRSMTLDNNKNQNKEQNNPNSFGGGIYAQNNNNNNYAQGGGGIYGNQNTNYIPPSTNIYGNNNKNQ